MSQRISTWLASSGCALGIVCTVGGLLLNEANRTAEMAAFIYPSGVAIAVCFSILGMIVAVRQPRNSLGWLFIAIGFCLAFQIFAILRYRLYDIDLIINRTLIYSLFTIILTTIWVASTTLIQQIAVQLAGEDAAVTSTVISTVVVIGILALGARAGGQGYSWDDRRGLTSFGREVGTKLFAAQLAERRENA